MSTYSASYPITIEIDEPQPFLSTNSASPPSPLNTPASNPSTQTPPIVPRNHAVKSPNKLRLNDYVYNRTLGTSHICSPKIFSATHIGFLASVSIVQEPQCFKHTRLDKNWILTMKQELNALERNGTLEFTTLPHGELAIRSKWIYKLKFNLNGSIDHYKTRLVA
ncbi:UNVERIFIED_CONTAM: hypothetical protein Sradi_6888300 [Sesamum radiatum]|uniref:Reverse transcriptase Ty1/copia-type domain-containing protein n=1 Tax=Sesamum radiatum TaxID=300843 RepID=A0AAW2JIN7_SESRA